MKKTLTLEFDDLHHKNPENCLDTIFRYVSRYPDIKLSFFTTSCHSGIPLTNNQDWCFQIRRLIGSNNIRLAVHGYLHTQEEFKYKTYEEAIEAIQLAEIEFHNANLSFAKVFRSPHWGVNRAIYFALEKLNYTHVYTHESYKELILPEQKIKSVIYNWNLKDSPPEDNLLIGHGHTHAVCSNGIKETFEKVCNFIDNNDVEFKFVDEI